MRFIALQPVWHSKEQKQFEVGESLSLEHLLPEQIQNLIEGGVVKPVEESSDGSGDASAPRARSEAADTIDVDKLRALRPPRPEPSPSRGKRANSKSEGE